MSLLPVWQEANENKLNRESRQAAGQFIHTFGNWQIFITLTFNQDVSESWAHKRFHEYCRKVAKRFSEHIDIAWCWGPQASGRIHFHALLKTRLDSLRTLSQRDFWGIKWPGNIKFDPPRDQEKSSCYLARREHHVWEINVACPKPPPCKRPGVSCSVARNPWPKPEELMGL